MHFKHFTLSIIALLSISAVAAQNNPFSKDIPKTPDGLHRCYTDQMAYDLYENNEAYRNSIDNEEVNRMLNPNHQQVLELFSDSVIRVPVVVHVLHNNGPENISKAQIESQIRILNEDFRRILGTNGFGPGVDTKVEFFLAQKDELGVCTDGIVRVQTPITNNGTDAQIKSVSPNWDPSKYLNFYIVNSIGGGGVLGYAYLPDILSSNPSIDGVVIADQFFGDIGTSGSGAFGLGRTATHEVGHWIGLRHTFQGGCSGMSNSNCFSNSISPSGSGDGVCDTPPVSSPNFGCNTSRNSCSENITILGGNAPDQVQNYMDYSDDFCFDRFTQGQKDRIMHMFNTYRFVHLDSNNAINAGLYGCNVPVTAAISGDDTVCVGEDVDLTFNLTGNPPFDIVYTDGSNNYSINGVFSPYTESINAAQGTFTYTIVSVTDLDSTKTAPDPALSGSAVVTAIFTGASAVTLSGTGALCEGDTTIINFSATGGTGPFDVEINNGVGMLTGVVNNSDILVTPDDTSTYMLLNVIDVNQCNASNFSSTASFNVTQSPNSFFLSSVNKGIVTFTNSTAGASSYSWDFGDGNSSTQQNPVHVYNSIGQYPVSLTSSNSLGCSNTFTSIVFISEISAIKGLQLGEEINIFPNPTKGKITLDISLISSQKVNVEVHNVNGQSFYSNSSEVNSKDHNLNIDLSELPSGIYFIKLSLDDGRILNSKIFKQ